MVTAPLLQHFEFEIAWGPRVSGPLTLCVSNRAGAALRRPAIRGGGNDMGTVINFQPARRTARGPGPMADRSEPAAVIILPVIRIERYAEPPSGDVEPEASSTARRRRRRRAHRS
jgi:hypothetical protein